MSDSADICDCAPTLKRRGERPAILAILDTAPFPPRDGVGYPIANILQGLAVHCNVDVLFLAPGPASQWRTDSSIDRVFRVDASGPGRPAWRLIKEILRGEPYFQGSYVRAAALPLSLRQRQYDVVYTSPAWLAVHGAALGRMLLKPGGKLVLGLNDSITEHFRRDWDLAKGPWLPLKRRVRHAVRGIRLGWMPRVERTVLSKFDVIAVQSSNDKDAIERDCGKTIATRVVVAPNGIKESLLRVPYGGANALRMVHVGALTGNRGDLLRWFAANVFREVRREIPEVSLHLYGSADGSLAAAIGRIEGVVLHGYVESLETAFERASLCIAPVFMRTGLINKVVDAMAAGIPCSGIRAFGGIPGFINGVHGHEPRSPNLWASELRELLAAPHALSAMSQNGRRLVEKELRWNCTVDVIMKAAGLERC